MSAQLLQFGGSLLAILALAWLVHRLGMGRGRRLDNEGAARQAADEVEAGFAAQEIAIDPKACAALLRDGAGQVIIVRTHGAHPVGRKLTRFASIRMEQERLVIDAGERRFGAVTLEVDDPETWIEAIRAL